MQAVDNSPGKPVLVLLHGFPLDVTMWRPQVEALSSQCRVITTSLYLASGLPAQVRSPVSISEMATSTMELLDIAAKDQQVIVCGLSMGGYVALAIARQYPTRLSGMILADTRAEPDDVTAKANRDRMIALVRKDGPTAIIDSMLPKLLGATTQKTQPQLIEEVRAMASRQSPLAIEAALIAMRDRSDARPHLAEIQVPTLVIVGEEDVVTPFESATNMMKAIPGARLEVIPKAGHLSNLENPTAFNLVVSRFISQIDAGA